MTTSIRLELEETHRAPLVAEDAYCLYGWLMEQLPPAYAAYLHEEGERPFCQYLLPSRRNAIRLCINGRCFRRTQCRWSRPSC